MGCMFRSDKMSFCDVYLQPEIAFELLSNLGEMGCVQIIDMHPELQLFQRNFVQEVCRCSEMERKLRYMQREMKFYNIQMPPLQDEPKAAPIHELIQFETMIEKWCRDVKEIKRNERDLKKNYLELNELLYVLQYIIHFLGKAEIPPDALSKSEKQLQKTRHSLATGDQQGRLIVFTGVIKRKRAFAFEMLLWRISRGMIYYRQAEQDKILYDPKTNREIRKVAFLAICQGETLASLVEKVCAGFRVNTYPCPTTYKDRTDMESKLILRIKDMDQVLQNTHYLRCKALWTVSRQWRGWMAQVCKSKAIYHQMNKFNLDISKKFLIGQAWVPDVDLEEVEKTFSKCCITLQTIVESFISKSGHNLNPPTYHRVNEFTRGFQNLINAYGTSSYRELNPGLYTVITFPFLFGIMFGDVGHGTLMFVFAAWMCIKEKEFLEVKSDNEIWNIIFGGRYVVLLMGAFSIYCGFLYNDCFGTIFTFFKSYFKNNLSVDLLRQDDFIDIDPSQETGDVYLFGLDPIWGLAKNKIMIENSTKMKLSIIIGIIHMIFGVCLSLFDHWHFKRYYAIFLQFIPEIVFLCCIFLWLVVMIFYKWFSYSAKSADPEFGTACAPQVLILFIDMALFTTSAPANENCKNAYMFEGQQIIQMCLITIALLMVPILLFGTPLYKLKSQNRKRQRALKRLRDFKNENESDEEDEQYKARLKAFEEEIAEHSHSFGELMIHQGVHTIEYVLSTISHTASYLRLWALSLAHAQLAEMLYHMIFAKMALKDHTIIGSIKVFIIFAMWAAFSVSILVVMEGLSAFLHTLRLHWVEFMSKFYEGTGYLFQPFSFKKILNEAEHTKTETGCKKMMHLLKE